MSQSSTTNQSPFGAVTYTNSALNATAVNNIRVGATTLYIVTIDNSANSAITYVQLWNNASPTVGTTAPNLIFACPASTKMSYYLDIAGYPFTTGLSLAATTTPTGSTNPATSITLYLLCS